VLFSCNLFIAHKVLAVFVSSYETEAVSYIHVWSIRHKLHRKVTSDNLKMAITRNLLLNEINFKTQVSLPLKEKS
jgi:hypothetical protein